MKRASKFGFRSLWREVRRKSARAGGEEGTALYELAMVLPLLSMMLIGIVWSGITFYDYVVLADAVAAGARTLAVSAGQGSGPPTACTLAQQTISSSTSNLNASKLSNPGTPWFAGGSTCTHLVEGDTAIVWAAYSCNLSIPFTNVNLCPVAQGPITVTTATGTVVTVGSCPFTYCVTSATTVDIE